MLPPSVLTSSDETASLALTTCMLNQYADVPDLLWSTSGAVMPHETNEYEMSRVPADSVPSSVKASWNRSRWPSSHSGHSSTI